jgi:hypothetical protein
MSVMRAPASGGGGEDAAVAGGACIVAAGGIVGAAQTNQAGPIIAGVVAIVVALVTWYATDRRQSKALDADQDRQERALTAEQGRHEATLVGERVRLDRRLEHEFQLADVMDLRTVLEASLAAADASFRTSVEVLLRDPVPDRLREEAMAVQKVLGHGTNALVLRLAEGHPVLAAHARLVEAHGNLYLAARERDRSTFDVHSATVATVYRELVEAAQNLIGSRLPETPVLDDPSSTAQ